MIVWEDCHGIATDSKRTPRPLGYRYVRLRVLHKKTLLLSGRFSRRRQIVQQEMRCNKRDTKDVPTLLILKAGPTDSANQNIALSAVGRIDGWMDAVAYSQTMFVTSSSIFRGPLSISYSTKTANRYPSQAFPWSDSRRYNDSATSTQLRRSSMNNSAAAFEGVGFETLFQACKAKI